MEHYDAQDLGFDPALLDWAEWEAERLDEGANACEPETPSAPTPVDARDAGLPVLDDGWRAMSSRFGGTRCAMCRQTIRRGDPIAWRKGDGARHLACGVQTVERDLDAGWAAVKVPASAERVIANGLAQLRAAHARSIRRTLGPGEVWRAMLAARQWGTVASVRVKVGWNYGQRPGDAEGGVWSAPWSELAQCHPDGRIELARVKTVRGEAGVSVERGRIVASGDAAVCIAVSA